MISVIKFKDHSISEQQDNVSVEDLLALAEPCGDERVWIDITTEDRALITRLLTHFKVDQHAIDDSLRKRHPSKVEFFDDHLFVLYRGIRSVDEEISFQHQSLSLIVKENLLISLHEAASVGVQQTRKTIHLAKLLSPMRIALHIMKSASSVYLERLLDFDSKLSQIEEQLEEDANDQLLKELTKYKSKLVKLTRTFNYHTDISEGFLKESDQYAYFDKEHCEHAIIDLDDRFHRLHTLSQMHYDICGDLIDGYLSISAHQLNETMRVLTVITAIFVPLGFLAGLYGMNFEYIPELKLANGYFYLLALMLCISGGLVYFFKRKRWL